MKCFRLFFTSLILCFLFISDLLAKDEKPIVLVYGDNIEAFAAALQSARSNVPTLWVVPSSTFCTDLMKDSTDVSIDNYLVGGIWMNLMEEISLGKEKSDSLFTVIQGAINPKVLYGKMENLLEVQQNLTLIKDVKVIDLVNKEKNVEVVLSNKKKFSVVAVVDATKEMDLSKFGNANKKEAAERKLSAGIVVQSLKTLDRNALRTLLAVGIAGDEVSGVTISDLLRQRINNVFFTESVGGVLLPLRASIGQAVGASAAYCAFFKTNAEKMDVRKVQTELLANDVRFIPFVDVSIVDSNFNALQKMFLTSILDWNRDRKPFRFSKTDSVKVELVRPVIQQFYSRSQLWFVDNVSVYFTTKDLIELLKVIAFRGDELDVEIAKAWKKRFHFESDFQLNHAVNKYEFAVLLESYASPFAKKVDFEGVIQR